jgi:hypothetical protein
MKWILCRCMVILLLCAFLLPTKTPAQSIAPSGGQVAVVVGVLAGVGAAIGIGIYYAFKHSPSIRGCAVSGPNGLQLQNEGDQKTFLLQGITNDVKSGDRVSVKGKKTKTAKGSTGNPTFLVEKLVKDYGACKVAPAMP